MSNTKNITRDKKMRTSKMAVLSPLLSILGVCLLVLLLYWDDVYKFFGLSLIPFYLTRFYVYGHLISGVMVVAGIVVGILMIKKGQDKSRILKTRRSAIVGIVVGVVFLSFGFFILPAVPLPLERDVPPTYRCLESG